jgi:type I restriction enzyme S subunit
MFGDPVRNPMGWEIVPLNSACNKIGDGLHGTPKYDDNGEFYFINGSNLCNGEIVVTPSTRKVGEDEYKKHNVTLDDNTILLSINGTLGRIAFYRGERLVLGKSACYCRLKENVDKVFILGIMKSESFQEYIRSEATASTINNVSLKTIREYPLIMPPLELQNRFASFVECVEAQKAQMKKGLELMELGYKSLMQKCFKGEMFYTPS